MSLVKKQTMTEQKIAANRRNGPLSIGPATEEGKERIAAAQLRHGFYAKAQEAALSCLGEDPAEYEELLQGLYEEFNPVSTLQKKLVERLARVLSLMDREDRSLEGHALRRAQSLDQARDNRLHARMMRLKMTAESLRSLARSVNCWHYVTPKEDLQVMKKLHQEGIMAEMGEIAMDIFYQLQEPNTDRDGVSEEETYRGAVNHFRSVFGIAPIDSPVKLLSPTGETMIIRPEGWEEPDASPDGEDGQDSDKDDRYPKITEEDWKARERARKLLRNILTRQREACEEQRNALLRESLAGPSPYECAAEVSPSPADALLTRRTQDGYMREVRRLTNLLLKIQRQGGGKKPAEASEQALIGQDVSENKGS